MDSEILTDEYFEFLNELRESGVTNMLGAGAYLQKEFGMDKHKAREILISWMASFPKGED